jgi:hypothetical protein
MSTVKPFPPIPPGSMHYVSRRQATAINKHCENMRKEIEELKAELARLRDAVGGA